MTTDDAPRPALDAATLVYGRERWEALNARWHSGPLPWDQETAQAVHWMAQHADALLAAAAERDALRERVAELEERHAIFCALEQDVTAALHRCGSELVRAQRRRREGAGDGA